MSALRSLFTRSAVRAPLLARSYGSPAANAAGKKQAEKAKSGTQENDHSHHTDSESAAKSEHSTQSIEDLQKDTEAHIKKTHH